MNMILNYIKGSISKKKRPPRSSLEYCTQFYALTGFPFWEVNTTAWLVEPSQVKKMAIYYDYWGKLVIYNVCSQNEGKWILSSTQYSFGVLCLVWDFHYRKETENWRDASRLPLRQFGGAGALNIDEVKENNCVCILENGKLKGDVIEIFQYLKGKYWGRRGRIFSEIHHVRIRYNHHREIPNI